MIGPRLAPLWVGPACEFAELFNERFWIVFEAWQRFNLGLWVPDPDSWLSDAVAQLEGQYRAHFSTEIAIMRRLDALIDSRAPKRVR
jgi:hypothetical protein